jgi:hypothetical protein
LSQIFKPTASGPPTPIPPTVPEIFITDVDSPAIPMANVLNVFGGQSTVNNNNGVQTDGSSGSNTITIQLTNRVTGTVSTIDATPTTLISFPLGATPAVYGFTGDIQGFDLTDIAGGTYTWGAGARTDGATATLIGTEFKDIFEEAGMAGTDFDILVVGNNLVVQVIGLAGNTINWDGLINFRLVM